MNGWAGCSSFILHRSSLLISLPHDLGSKRIEPLLDLFVSAINLIDVVDRALALGAERGKKQGHPGTDVGTGDLRADEPVAADDDGAVRIAQDDPRAHRRQLVGEKQARLE